MLLICVVVSCVVASTYKDELPYLRGEEYITQVSMENIEEHTKSRPANKPTLLYIGAKWCPHCKHFKPKYNIIADHIQHNKTEGIRPKCLYYEAIEDKDPIATKFKLSGYPVILLFENNKFYRYEGAKEFEPIINWLDNRPEILAENYPDYVPGFVDELIDASTQMWKSIRASYKKDPSTHFYLYGAIAVVLGGFGITFIYAVLATVFGPSKEKQQ